MTVHPEFPQRSETPIPSLTYDAIRMALKHEATTRNMMDQTDTHAEITVQIKRGMLSFSPTNEDVLAHGNSAPDTIGQVILLADESADWTYPIHAPGGVSIIWHNHSEGTDFAAPAINGALTTPDHYLWVACEKSDALRMRGVFKNTSSVPAQSHILAYWSRS
ncbi:Siderophore-interacting protein [Ruegeria halocynthiae]|uniref:Siderophore-interacting protein n=1 Tax=Ruegeria halocynthiae TaxID=985054 RepID=A0A1H2XZJ3_9RHOB|nr:SIP domain-containing protein [Ruegeria halocynthiae]SDW98276.1 Siderophore-interacting protein [Ruegeria halocynthiae]